MDIENRLQWLEREITELRKIIGKREESSYSDKVVHSKNWKPKNNEEYYYITNDGYCLSGFWNFKKEEELDMLEIGNVFQTEHEANFVAERLRVIRELKEFTRPFIPNQENWVMTFNCDTNCIQVGFSKNLRGNDLFFASSKEIYKALETIGEERIRKYYFQVDVTE